MEAKRDGNRVTTKLAAFGTTPTSLKVEHATGFLKAKIIPTTLSAPTSIPLVARRDPNRVTSALGTNTTPLPLFVTHADKYLRAVNN